MNSTASTSFSGRKNGFCGLAFLLAMTCVFILPTVTSAAEKIPLPPGVKVMAEKRLTWAEAKEFCRQQGGKLPLVNGLESSDYPVANTPIDGFGTVGGPWPAEFADLPKAVRFWTGTEDISDMEEGEDTAWHVYERGGTVGVGNASQSAATRVVCVP